MDEIMDEIMEWNHRNAAVTRHFHGLAHVFPAPLARILAGARAARYGSL
jgi:hypothetical protein